MTTGPGPNCMRRTLNQVPSGSFRRIILFGVAGGLCETEPSPEISYVVNPTTGERWTSPLSSSSGATVAGVDTPLLTPTDKRAMHERTNAQLVDTESHVFAAHCTSHHWNWAIIRGVSDGPDESLPACVGGWVGDDGRTRAGRVARDLLMRPALLQRVRRLGRSTSRALDAASVRLDALLNTDADTIAPS